MRDGDRPRPDARGVHHEWPAPGGQRGRAGRDFHPGSVCGGYCPVGHKGPGPGTDGLLLVGRIPGPGANLRQRRIDTTDEPGVPGRSRAPTGGDGFQADEDPDGRRVDPGTGSGANAGDAGGHRAGHRPDVRHQPALERQPSDRHWEAGGGV